MTAPDPVVVWMRREVRKELAAGVAVGLLALGVLVLFVVGVRVIL